MNTDAIKLSWMKFADLAGLGSEGWLDRVMLDTSDARLDGQRAAAVKPGLMAHSASELRAKLSREEPNASNRARKSWVVSRRAPSTSRHPMNASAAR